MKRLFLSLLFTLLALFILLPDKGQAIQQQQCGVEFTITGTGTATARNPNDAREAAQKATKYDYDQKVKAYQTQCPAACPVLKRTSIIDSTWACTQPFPNVPPTTCQGWMWATFECQPQ